MASLARYAKPAMLFVASATIALFAAESALHVFARKPEVTSEWTLLAEDVLDPDTVISFPQFGEDAYYALDESHPTVVMLGDSFTQSWPVANEDGFPKVLGRLCESAGTPVNTIDLGMGDTGPDQHLRLFEREVLSRLTPEAVVWQFYPNDEWDNATKAAYTTDGDRLVPIDAKRNWIYRRRVFYDLVPFADTLRRRSYLFRYVLILAERGNTSAVPPEYKTKPREWGLEKIGLAVQRMNELAREHEFRPYYVLIAPDAIQPAVEKATTNPARLSRWIQAYDRVFDVLSVEPTFIDARFFDSDGRTLRNDIFIDDERDSMPLGARHYNERGYRMLAELVRDRLVADGALSR